jgi:rRNA processing protein Gar1
MRPGAAGVEVGTVLAITPAGDLTVRASDGRVVPEGSSVNDSRGKRIGRVVRVFGPVDRPYLTVKPRRTPSPDEAVRLVGSTLVQEESESHGG